MHQPSSHSVTRRSAPKPLSLPTCTRYATELALAVRQRPMALFLIDGRLYREAVTVAETTAGRTCSSLLMQENRSNLHHVLVGVYDGQVQEVRSLQILEDLIAMPDLEVA